MSEQLPSANAPKPWEEVGQEGLFVSEDKQGKGIAFKNPEDGKILFIGQKEIVTLSPDGKTHLGHITMGELVNFVDKAKAHKPTSPQK